VKKYSSLELEMNTEKGTLEKMDLLTFFYAFLFFSLTPNITLSDRLHDTVKLKRMCCQPVWARREPHLRMGYSRSS
jgi:hypothetical protein